jgi:hypothetical protein
MKPAELLRIRAETQRKLIDVVQALLAALETNDQLRQALAGGPDTLGPAPPSLGTALGGLLD